MYNIIVSSTVLKQNLSSHNLKLEYNLLQNTASAKANIGT